MTRRGSSSKKPHSKRKQSPSEKRCKKLLKNKIKINMHEMKEGKFKHRGQALAVSYSQIKKKCPECKKYFKR